MIVRCVPCRWRLPAGLARPAVSALLLSLFVCGCSAAAEDRAAPADGDSTPATRDGGTAADASGVDAQPADTGTAPADLGDPRPADGASPEDASAVDGGGLDAAVDDDDLGSPADLGCPGEPGVGAACVTAGVAGRWACLGGVSRCQLAPGATLCGSFDGVLAPGATPYRLGCTLVVPVGARLDAGRGVVLDSGTQRVRVEGVAELVGVAVRAVGGVGIEVAAGGELTMIDGYLLARGNVGEPLIRVAGGARATLTGVQLRDPEGRAVGLLVEGDAAPRLRSVTFAGPWIGLRATQQARPQVETSRFLACGTGLMADGEARPVVFRSEFSGAGRHLWFDPDTLRPLDDGQPWAGTNHFEGGTALTLAGSLGGSLRLEASPALDTVALLGVQVLAGAALELRPGWTAEVLGGPLRVDGSLVVEGVGWTATAGTLVDVGPGGRAALGSSVFTGAGLAGEPLLRLSGGTLTVRGGRLDDLDGSGLGIEADGALELRDSELVGLWTGVRVAPGSLLRLEGNRFVDCAIAVGLQGALAVSDPALPGGLSGNQFEGAGLPLLVDPDLFDVQAGDAPLPLTGNLFATEGPPLLIAGVLQGHAALRRLGELPLLLGPVTVAAGASLGLAADQAPGLALFLGDDSLVVEGELTLADVTLAGGRAALLEFRPGSVGELLRLTLRPAPPGGPAIPALVRVDDASPRLRHVAFAGEGAAEVGLLVEGRDAQRPASPEIDGCSFAGVRVGILVRGSAEPQLGDNLFAEGVTPTCPGSVGCP